MGETTRFVKFWFVGKKTCGEKFGFRNFGLWPKPLVGEKSRLC